MLRKPSTNVAYTVSATMTRSGRFSNTRSRSWISFSGRIARLSGLPGLTTKKTLIVGSRSCSRKASSNRYGALWAARSSTTRNPKLSSTGIWRYGVKIGVVMAMASPGLTMWLACRVLKT